MCSRITVAFLGFFILAGCDSSGHSSDASSEPLPQNAAEAVLPAGIAASVAGPQPDDFEDGSRAGGHQSAANVDPVAGLLSEIELLRVNGVSRSDAASDPNRKIVLKATDVLKLTMQDESRATDFLAAVRHLLQARLELALAGSAADVDQLYADVQALNEHDPGSAPAAEGIYYLAKFAHTKARQARQNRAEWNVNFSRWAREFATRFPQQSERALSLLFGAGRSCEMAAATAKSAEESALLRAEARLCHVLLMEKWPNEPQGQEAVAVLRRLDLPGRALSQFSGPTLSGGRVTAEEFPGRLTLIYFWDSESYDFKREWLPLLRKVEDRIPSDRIRFIGVNLDDNPEQCREFVRNPGVPGEQICFPDDQCRGWNCPLVRFWGVSQSPSVWLVDSAGVVDAVDVRREALESRITSLLSSTSRN